jgi:hypothetical protein
MISRERKEELEALRKRVFEYVLAHEGARMKAISEGTGIPRFRVVWLVTATPCLYEDDDNRIYVNRAIDGGRARG